MALIEYDVYKQKLRDLEPELKKLGDALDIDAVAQEAARLEDETTQDGFWNNLERSQKVQTRLKQLQNKLHRFKKLMSTWEDLTTLCEMGQEAEDEEILEELKTEFPALETEIEEIRMTTLLSGAAAPRPRTGARCSTGCTPAGRSVTATLGKRWTTRNVTRPVSNLPLFPSRARMPTAC